MNKSRDTPGDEQDHCESQDHADGNGYRLEGSCAPAGQSVKERTESLDFPGGAERAGTEPPRPHRSTRRRRVETAVPWASLSTAR